LGTVFRAKIYRLFSLIFSEPSESCVIEIDKILNDLASESRSYIDRFNANELYLNLSSERESILDECTRLFGESKGSKICSPHERDYRGDKIIPPLKLLYNEIGFSPQEDLIDHISVELEFAYKLLLSNINIDKRDKILMDFLKEHALKWMYEFIECVRNNTTSKFYVKAAKALENLLSFEQEYLGVS